MGLGRAKTRARCSAVEWRSKTANVLAFSREAHVTMLTDAPRQKSRNPVIPTLLARGIRHAFLVQCVEGVALPEACGKKIPTIFAPYTFSHSQGQRETKKSLASSRCRASLMPQFLP